MLGDQAKPSTVTDEATRGSEEENCFHFSILCEVEVRERKISAGAKRRACNDSDEGPKRALARAWRSDATNSFPRFFEGSGIVEFTKTPGGLPGCGPIVT